MLLHLQSLEHFRFAFLHLHEEQLDVQVHLTSSLNTSLAKGKVTHFGTSLPYISDHPWSMGFIAGIIALSAEIES